MFEVFSLFDLFQLIIIVLIPFLLIYRSLCAETGDTTGRQQSGKEEEKRRGTVTPTATMVLICKLTSVIVVIYTCTAECVKAHETQIVILQQGSCSFLTNKTGRGFAGKWLRIKCALEVCSLVCFFCRWSYHTNNSEKYIYHLRTDSLKSHKYNMVEMVDVKTKKLFLEKKRPTCACKAL